MDHAMKLTQAPVHQEIVRVLIPRFASPKRVVSPRVTVALAIATTMVLRMERFVTIIMSALRTTSAAEERVQVIHLFAPTYAGKIRLDPVLVVLMKLLSPANFFAVLRIPITAFPAERKTAIPVSLGTPTLVF